MIPSAPNWTGHYQHPQRLQNILAYSACSNSYHPYLTFYLVFFCPSLNICDFIVVLAQYVLFIIDTVVDYYNRQKGKHKKII